MIDIRSQNLIRFSRSLPSLHEKVNLPIHSYTLNVNSKHRSKKRMFNFNLGDQSSDALDCLVKRIEHILLDVIYSLKRYPPSALT